MADIKQNLTADLQANNGQIPFEALRTLRSRVGALLDDSLVSGIPGGELKKLYRVSPRTSKLRLMQSGAGQEFARQSNYYKARMERIEGTLDSVWVRVESPRRSSKPLLLLT
jgi:hypothetical protein